MQVAVAQGGECDDAKVQGLGKRRDGWAEIE